MKKIICNHMADRTIDHYLPGFVFRFVEDLSRRGMQ